MGRAGPLLHGFSFTPRRALLEAATSPASPAAAVLVLAAASQLPPVQQPAEVPAPGPCRIIQGPPALLAQLVLLVIVVSALILKRHRERPRRQWNVWFLDVSKQACSAGMGHLCGMGIAVIAHRRATGASECGWYLIVYLMDCTLGITLAIVFHRLMHRVVRWHQARLQAAASSGRSTDRDHHPWTEALLESGNYGDPPIMRRWAIQAAGWVTCVVSARLSVGVVVLNTLPLMGSVAAALDTAFAGQPHMELFTVMVGIPMLLNVGQAWIQDQVLKWKARRHIKRGALDQPQGSGELPLQQSTEVLREPGASRIRAGAEKAAGEKTPIHA